MRKLRKITPAEVEEEKLLDPEVIGDVLENTPVLNNEELEDMDAVVPNFDEEDEDTEGDIDLDTIGEVLENTHALTNEELEDMDAVVPNFDEEDEDTEPEIHEEDLDLDAIGEVLKDEELAVKSKPVAKKAKSTKKTTTKKSKSTKSKPTQRTTIKVAVPTTLTAEEFKAKKSVNMSDLSAFIFTYLADHQPATKKNIEEMVSLIFTDILPSHMDNEHPIRLGDLRIGYSKVSGRVYENSKLSESLQQLGEFDTYVEPHTVARFKREINKVSHKGKLSPTKKTFTLAEADENGKFKLTKKTIKL